MLPGWDSIEFTSAVAKWSTFAGFAFLFLLGASEVLTYLYSGREANLREIVATRKAADLKAESDARIAEAQRGAAEASTKAEGFRLEIAKANESAK
jgi:hypothetical protein